MPDMLSQPTRTDAAALRPVAVCVDDYGLHAGVDEASVRLVEMGHVSAVSVMSGGTSWLAGAAALRALPASRVDVGLHLNFSEDVGDGEPSWPLTRLIALSHLRLLPASRLRESVRRQLDRLVQALGRPPAHVDGHQHAHQWPQIRTVLLDVLAEELDRLGAGPGSPQSPWLRSGRAPSDPALPLRRKAQVIEVLGAASIERLARRRGWHCSSHLLGVYGFDGDEQAYADLLQRWAGLSRPGDLIMCHPATHAPEGDVIGAARVREWLVWSRPDLAQRLAQVGVRVAPLSQWLAGADAGGAATAGQGAPGAT